MTTMKLAERMTRLGTETAFEVLARAIQFHPRRRLVAKTAVSYARPEDTRS